jgi:hypothetical protein
MLPLLKKYKWVTPPSFYGDGGFHWYRKVKLKQPFLLNLSTYVFEDFNVSLAQARVIGWPLVLSNWAVFRELGDLAIVRLDANKILKYEKLKTAKSQDKLVANLITQTVRLISLNKEISQREIFSESFKLPRILDASALSSLQKRWTLKKRKELVAGMMMREPGNKYFMKLEKCFS